MVHTTLTRTGFAKILALWALALPLPAFCNPTDEENATTFPSGSIAPAPAKGAVEESYEDSLPLLGDNSSSILTLAEERALGLKWLHGLRGSIAVSSDPLIQHYLENLLAKLAEKSELIDRTLFPIVIKDNSLNAFAAPGGIVGVNTGLFNKARSEGELSAVLAHELAHLSQRHYARRVQSGKLTSVAGLVLILSSILAALSGGSDTGLAAIYAGTAALQASQLNYSRRDEREADRIGLRTLVKAGYSPEAAVNMFETLRDTYNLGSDRPPEYLLTHPYTEARLSDARARAQQLIRDGSSGMLDRPLFHIIKIHAAMEDQPSISKWAMELEDRLKKASGIDRVFASYALAATYNQLNRYEEALALLEDIPEEQIIYSLEMPLALLKGRILLDSGEKTAALDWISSYAQRHHNFYPMDVLYAEALVDNLKYQEAEQILRTLRTYRPQDPLIWQLLSDVQLLGGNVLEYHRSSARYHELNGRYRSALQHVNEAVRLASEDDQLHEALQEQLQQLATLAQEQLY